MISLKQGVGLKVTLWSSRPQILTSTTILQFFYLWKKTLYPQRMEELNE